MTLLYYDPVFLEHDTGDHPESARRIVPAVRNLDQVAMHLKCRRLSFTQATSEELARVHAMDYVRAIDGLAERDGGYIEQDTVVCPRSPLAARMAAGAVCDAVRKVARGEDQRAFCLVRPPGHHALHDAPMGFCLFNSVAVGARVATMELGLERVLIVDWDVHHGNGTQDAFWEDPRVGFFSIHRWPFYPGTGAADETGGGAGRGTTVNEPVRFGTPRREYLERFEASLGALADEMKPELILISAGFDAHRDDPVGSLGLESEDFATLTRAVLEVADRHAGGRVVSVLEGGYNPTAVAECVEQHLHELVSA